MTMNPLTFSDHNRDVMGLTYVYPVLSRRAEGISIGINLTPNNACNWACVYCQVPNLVRGSAPPLNAKQLENELTKMLHEVMHGSFMEEYAPPEYRRLNDIAFSGNGEPTSSKEFPIAMNIVHQALEQFGLMHQIKVVLITNGSHIQDPKLHESLIQLNNMDGEIWFKIDRATPEGIWSVNQVHLQPETILERLAIATNLCKTYIQTCMTQWNGADPSEEEIAHYLDFLKKVQKRHIPIQGIWLYSLARPSLQPDQEHLSSVSSQWLDHLAHRIQLQGFSVRVTP